MPHIDIDQVNRIREEVLAGLATLPVFAAAIGKDIRTVQRMIKKGDVEITKIGGTSFVVVSSFAHSLKSKAAR